MALCLKLLTPKFILPTKQPVVNMLLNYISKQHICFKTQLPAYQRGMLPIICNNLVFCTSEPTATQTSSPLVDQRRYKRKAFKIKKQMEAKANKLAKQSVAEDLESEDEESDSDDDEEGYIPQGYKDVTLVVSSLRIDGLLSSGLSVPRMTIEDAFYANKILINGQTVSKKSTMMYQGDIADLIINEEEEKLTVKRLILKKVFTDVLPNMSIKVEVRRWKEGLEIDKP